MAEEGRVMYHERAGFPLLRGLKVKEVVGGESDQTLIGRSLRAIGEYVQLGDAKV